MNFKLQKRIRPGICPGRYTQSLCCHLRGRPCCSWGCSGCWPVSDGGGRHDGRRGCKCRSPQLRTTERHPAQPKRGVRCSARSISLVGSNCGRALRRSDETRGDHLLLHGPSLPAVTPPQRTVLKLAAKSKSGARGRVIIIGITDEGFGGPERRQKSNANLRAIWTNSFKNLSASSKITEDDLSQLFELMRDYYLSDFGSRSSDLLQLVREQHADELNPALLALLDSVMRRRS